MCNSKNQYNIIEKCLKNVCFKINCNMVKTQTLQQLY